MGSVELLLVAIGLAMDAFAVSVCKGLAMPRLDARRMIVLAASFGAFQALMPLLGYALGASFASLIEPIDHWIAFVLLGFIGAKMVHDSLVDEPAAEAGKEESVRLDPRELLALSVATSIDALAVGISFALLDVSIVRAAAVIGVVTFVLSVAGVAIGRLFGARFERAALAAGGLVLIAIGLRILLEHLGIIGF